MPPFVPLADGAQVHIVFTLGGKVVENRLWFVDRNPPVTSAHTAALAAGVYSWHTSELLPWLSSDLQLAAVEAFDWTSDPPPSIGVVSTPVNGGTLEQSHSANVAVRVRFKGDNTQTFPSNSHFVPGIPLSAVDINEYTTAFRGRLLSAYADLIDLAATFGGFPGWRWVITSRQLNNAWRSTQDFARTDFIQFPSPYVSPRRRRLPRP